MKKTIILLTALTLLLVLNGCGGGKSNNNSSNKTGNQTNIATPNNCTGGGEIKHGYQLPPCPDPVENAKTLLGIDTNSNGVRDDVEIWIYHHYDTYTPCVEQEINFTLPSGEVTRAFQDVCENTTKTYHQIVREIAMQYAKAYQIVIQEPKKARETMKYVDSAQYCSWYFEFDAKQNNEPLLVETNSMYYELDKIQFNTIKRARAYSEYNFYLSGGAYGSPKGSLKRFCDFNVDTLLGK